VSWLAFDEPRAALVEGSSVTSTVLKQTERAFERAVVEYVQLLGWRVYHTYDSRRSNPGFPDLVLVRDGFALFIELKAEKGRVSIAQQEWIDALDLVAGETDRVGVFVWRPSDWAEIELVLA
jgi:hypothetical protein